MNGTDKNMKMLLDLKTHLKFVMEELSDSSSMEQDTMIVLYDECADLQRRLIEVVGTD